MRDVRRWPGLRYGWGVWAIKFLHARPYTFCVCVCGGGVFCLSALSLSLSLSLSLNNFVILNVGGGGGGKKTCFTGEASLPFVEFQNNHVN